ncbi:bromodomain-containing protein 7 [Arapaima gigas]
MGKKHKKHKSEKHVYEEYPEKPLRLVLKVAGSEVTELSTGSSGHDTAAGDDGLEHDRHRDRKKKKKKKGEKERGSPAPSSDDHRKRKVSKKKGQDSIDTDFDEKEQSHTPVRSEVPQEKHLTPSIAKIEEKEQTPLQEALSQLIRQLQRKDPSAFFSFPVTDFIAPGYSMIIKKPMDFSTMKEKVKKNYYQSLEELKEDFKTMCENAMIYNKPETIYYKAAKKLLHSGLKILSQERLQSLKQSIEFMADLENKNTEDGEPEKEGACSLDLSKDSQVAMATPETPQSPRRISKDTPRQDKDSKEESLKNGTTQAERELEEIRKVIEDSGGKLSNRELQSELEFERRKADGTTTLGILNPADLSAGDTGYCPVKLGMMVGRLQSGINTLQGFKEDKRNKVTPVVYMNYGPFSSYAPVYDSSFANVSKEDSDLIYSFYGEESSLQGSESISEFLSNTEEYVSKVADNILDALTNGEYSKSLFEMESATQEGEDPAEGESANDVEIIETEPSSKSSLAPLSSATRLGLALDVEHPAFDSEEAKQFQQKLDETTLLLRELQEVQNERLSFKPPPSIICLLAPSGRELQLAERVTGNLAHLVGQVTPGDVSSVYGVRKAMGISLPMDLMGENHINHTTESDTPEPADIFLASEEDMAVTI